MCLRLALADEERMPVLRLFLSTAIACSGFLMPASGVAQDMAASLADEPSRFEHTAWKLIRNSDDPADFQTYLDIFPNGRFKLTAKQRITQRTEQRRQSRTIVLEPASRFASEVPKQQLPATRSAKSKLTAIRPPTPPRKKPDVVPAPAAYVRAAPQPQMPATMRSEQKPIANAESQPVIEPEPVDPLDCAMGGMDSE
jgi:hypothetical protein